MAHFHVEVHPCERVDLDGPIPQQFGVVRVLIGEEIEAEDLGDWRGLQLDQDLPFVEPFDQTLGVCDMKQGSLMNLL